LTAIFFLTSTVVFLRAESAEDSFHHFSVDCVEALWLRV
jgi:hypothetical protein